MLEALYLQFDSHDAVWKQRKSRITTRYVFEFLVSCIGRHNSSYSKSLGFLRRHRAAVAKSSMCAARKKIRGVFFRSSLHEIVKAIDPLIEREALWRGRQVYAVDGTRINLPHELKATKYKATHRGCHYPQALVTAMVQLKTRIPKHFVVCRRAAETRTVGEHLRQLSPGAVVAYDRLYFCLNTLKEHHKTGVDGVFRLRTGGTFKEVTNFIASGEREQITTICRDGLVLTIRFLRYKVAGQVYFLGTTLLDPERFPLHALKDLYHSRWGIEETFKFIKQELKVEQFHSRTINGIKQEIGVAMILCAFAAVLSMRSTRRKKISMGCANQHVVDLIPYWTTPSGIVRNTAIDNLIELVGAYRHGSPPGRSFPRRSRKVISRWQKSIARQWAKAKQLERRAMQP